MDTKILRKNMFINNNEREDSIYRSRMRGMGWDTGRKTLKWDATSISNQALQNADILEHIVVHLSHKDLLNCRLVCRWWSREMAKFLYKRRSIIVVNDYCENADNLIKKRMAGDPIAISRLSLFRTSSDCVLYKKLFSNFGCTLSIVSTEDCGLTAKDLKIMLIDIAPNIESFSLRQTEHNSRVNLSTFKQIKLLNHDVFRLPRLKFLHWDEEQGNTCLEDIVEACPSLEKLEFRNFPVPNAKFFKNLKWCSLSKLFLSPKSVLSEDLCEALIKLELNLKKLTLFGINPNDKKAMKSLTRLLATVAETLEVLEMWLDYPTVMSGFHRESFSPLHVTLPRVKRLQTEAIIIGHFNNLSTFPAMTELEIVSNLFEGARLDWSDLTKRSRITPQINLDSFRCGEIDGKSLIKVLKTYPSITRLQLYGTHVDSSVFRSIVTNLPGIKELTVGPGPKSYYLKLSDSGLTGVANEICKKYLKQPNKIAGETDFMSVKTQPGISDLKHLEMLNLGLQKSEMTDASVFFGISRLPNLCTLKLPLCKITDVALDVIGKNLNRLTLLGISGCDVSSEAITRLQKQKKTVIFDNELLPLDF